MTGRTLLLRLSAPLRSRLTYRRWSGLIVGGALVMPYLMVGDLVTTAWSGQGSRSLLALVDPGVFLAALPVIAVTGLVLPIRAVAISAARALFGVHLDVPESDARTWPQRWRTAAWFTALLGLGGVVSGLTLALLPFAAWLVTYPLTGDWLGGASEARMPGGWPAAWTVPLGLLVPPLLAYAVAGAGAVLGRMAPPLLGPTPEDRLAAAERRSEQLAERNRLARELHDSVGHALSVVTVQAAAGGRVLDTDPAFARRALAAIEESARGALEDLDYVLGLLREEEADSAPEPTLDDLGDLLGATGLQADVRIDGPMERVPRTVSREAYRIVQEGLTNALRHGHGDDAVRVDLRIAVAEEQVEVTMTNALRPPSAGSPAERASGVTGPGYGGGRGLSGMRERVRLLRGDLAAGEVEGHWRLAVRLPLKASAVRS